MAYCYPNYKTKKKLREAVASGLRVIVRENTPFGQKDVAIGSATLEGPHYPEAHKWYASVKVANGQIVSVK